MTYRRNRPRIANDNVGDPCDCLLCKAAEVTHLPIVRVPADETCATPHWLHGEPLKRWHAARENTRAQFAALRDKLSMPAKPIDGATESRK